MDLRKYIRKVLSENFENKNISDIVRMLTKKYNEEYGVSCDFINQGDCENFAEELHDMLKEVGIKSEILSDGLFFDPFGDMEDEMMWDASQYGKAPHDFKKVGLPSHYWIYVGGKHYDSDAPDGVYDMFDLPIIKNFYKKKSELTKESKNKNIFDASYYLDDFYAMDFNNEKTEQNAVEIIQKVIDQVRGFKYPMTVYRAIDTRSGRDLDFENSSWSQKKEVAKGFGDKLFTGIIPSESIIDLEQTIRTRVMNPGEYEIYVPNSIGVEIVSTEHSRISEQTIDNQPSTNDLTSPEIVQKKHFMNEADYAEINNSHKSLKKLLNSQEAYDILDSTAANGSTWTAGGCAILAFALNKAFGYPVYAIFDNDLNHVDHLVVKMPDGKFLDYDGANKNKLKSFKALEGLQGRNMSLVPFTSDMETSGIVFDSEASERLSDLIKGSGGYQRK